ncbi:4-alpha-glucanotransferase [Corallincola luteus]|uniref:4-alpha-glucanotransferase n=1 Tax=Corallincola luteus TaxID=1775177 RepID=A0ABY2AKE5_9GAMM|nr:4-alpha-glucanotransferase [Corallincola luteus]TCI01847.1 4-alpha-glucanotransferase [Corallincola luteus]
MNQELIEKLSLLRGVESNYVDAWGNPATVDASSKAALLSAMGYATEDDAKLEQQYQANLASVWQNMLPKVLVVRKSESYPLELHLPIDDLKVPVNWTLELEDGEKLKGTFTPLDGQLVGSETIEGVEYKALKVFLKLDAPIGYHTLVLRNAKRKKLADTRFIIAPQASYIPNEIASGKKVWGPSVQMYCLRSQRNWGIGDFTDLTYLVENVAKGGGDFVGLNPIHALYPNNPESASPYSPSSRRWLNVVYIDVEATPEYNASSEAQALVNSNDFQWRLGELRGKDWVDYTGVTQLKLKALRLVFNTFKETVLGSGNEREQAFQAFVAEGGENLREQALYDALQEYFYADGINAWGWPSWPAEFNEYHKPAVAKWAKANPDELNFYLYLQFLADEQLAAVDEKAKGLGMAMGLYRDLAVGVSEGSTEIWANRDLYIAGAAVGAPPDVLGPLGQNWGLPPMDPGKLIEQQYQPMIDLFRSNMRSCGALRIDHVMALLRLWMIPAGKDAKGGAYVYYNIQDLLGILALESHRNHCAIIGEDLGTVPDGISETLQENGVHSYRVFFFEQAEDGGFISPNHYPVQAMATLTTHDMPTLIGFWHCDDLKLGKELGLYPDDNVLQTLYNDRHESKQKILDSLKGHQSLPDYISNDVNWVGMTRDLNYGMQVHMAKGSSSLLSLQLEDWLEMDKPVNVPGTSTEYPNWRRKLSKDLDKLFAEHDVQELMSKLSDARRGASN